MQKKALALERLPLTYCTRKPCPHRFEDLPRPSERRQIDLFNASLVQLKFLLRSYLHLRSSAVIAKLQFSLASHGRFNLLSPQELRVAKKWRT